MNVHHLPICTTFYFLKDPTKAKAMDESVDALRPLIDVNSTEEKLCQSRLSIVLNAYGDLCGMTTLGALEIGGNMAQSEGSDEAESEQND